MTQADWTLMHDTNAMLTRNGFTPLTLAEYKAIIRQGEAWGRRQGIIASADNS